MNEVNEVYEVKKLTQSINYIHEAYRNYLQNYQEVLIKNELHSINCVNIFINLDGIFMNRHMQTLHEFM